MKLIIPIIIFTLSAPAIVSAHVGYVVPGSKIGDNLGSDFPFLFNPLNDPLNVSLIIGTILILAALYFSLRKNLFFINRAAFLVKEARSYFELVPWMMRLSLGITLIGAGSANAFISPLNSQFPQFSFIQILLGFLMLSGFLLSPATIAAIALFVLSFFKSFYLAGNLDFIALAISLLILGNPKPGLDDLLGIPFLSPLKLLKEWMPFILRLGIGGAMIFLALYEKILNPHLSDLVVQSYHLTSLIPVSSEMWILSAGLVELAVGFLLLFGFQTRLVATIAFLVLTLSFFYFHEEVYSHITLFGTLSVLLVTGGGKLSLDQLGPWFKRFEGGS